MFRYISHVRLDNEFVMQKLRPTFLNLNRLGSSYQLLYDFNHASAYLAKQVFILGRCGVQMKEQRNARGVKYLYAIKCLSDETFHSHSYLNVASETDAEIFKISSKYHTKLFLHNSTKLSCQQIWQITTNRHMSRSQGYPGSWTPGSRIRDLGRCWILYFHLLVGSQGSWILSRQYCRGILGTLDLRKKRYHWILWIMNFFGQVIVVSCGSLYSFAQQ